MLANRIKITLIGTFALMLSSAVFAADMMREDREQLKRLEQPGVDLPANLNQNLPPSVKKACLQKDKSRMGGHSSNDKYSCMPGYENVPQRDVGDLDGAPKGEHPIFEERMGGHD